MKLSDELLIEAYLTANKLSLEKDFIQLLYNELCNRKMESKLSKYE